jgi:glycosyltransferase involved in cell wall biosynthesis
MAFRAEPTSVVADDAAPGPAPEPTHTLLLAPSRGLGGGIERFVATVEAAFQREGVSYRRMDLLGPGNGSGLRNKVAFARRVVAAVRASRQPVRLVVAHPNLLPLVRLVSRLGAFRGATVLLYGIDIWGRRVRGGRIMRRRDVRVVTISGFSSGALLRTCRATVLHPGLTAQWYDTLVAAGERIRPAADTVELVTAFRLADWRAKGLPTVLDAIALLDDDRVRLTVCGSGAVPADLRAAVTRHPWCRIVADLGDEALAERLAAADVFVLATRTRTGRAAYGEGFGLVLLEAQVAGTPVVAPAYGGCGDAYQPGLTGLAPVDESPAALAAVLRRMLADERLRAAMGAAAASWARARFDLDRYARQVVDTLLAVC